MFGFAQLLCTHLGCKHTRVAHNEIFGETFEELCSDSGGGGCRCNRKNNFTHGAFLRDYAPVFRINKQRRRAARAADSIRTRPFIQLNTLAVGSRLISRGSFQLSSSDPILSVTKGKISERWISLKKILIC